MILLAKCKKSEEESMQVLAWCTDAKYHYFIEFENGGEKINVASWKSSRDTGFMGEVFKLLERQDVEWKFPFVNERSDILRLQSSLEELTPLAETKGKNPHNLHTHEGHLYCVLPKSEFNVDYIVNLLRFEEAPLHLANMRYAIETKNEFTLALGPGYRTFDDIEVLSDDLLHKAIYAAALGLKELHTRGYSHGALHTRCIIQRQDGTFVLYAPHETVSRSDVSNFAQILELLPTDYKEIITKIETDAYTAMNGVVEDIIDGIRAGT